MNILFNILFIAHVLLAIYALIDSLYLSRRNTSPVNESMYPLTGTKVDADERDSLTGTAPLPNEKQQGGN